MWTVVYIAQNRPIAEMLKDMLTKEGLLIMLRSVGVAPIFGDSGAVEILVPDGETEEAHEILAAVLGG